MAQLIVHGVFDRIPELRFYFAEINAALFPASLYYMDRDYLEYNSWFQLELPKMPSEYMREHALYGMVREPLAVKMGEELPEDMPLDLFWWGSDFPHSVGTFPHSQDYIEETFAEPRRRAPAHDPRRATRPSTCTSISTPTSPRRPPPSCAATQAKKGARPDLPRIDRLLAPTRTSGAGAEAFERRVRVATPRSTSRSPTASVNGAEPHT